MESDEKTLLEKEDDQTPSVEELTDEDLEDVGGGWSGDPGGGG